MAQNFISIGEAMIELTHESDARMRLAVAGDTFNTAVHLRRLLSGGPHVSYVTAVGNDWYSERVIEQLERERIQPVVRRVPDGLVGMYLVRTDSAGERSFTYYRSTSAATTMYDAGWPADMDETVQSAGVVYYSAITLQILMPPQRERLWLLIEDARAKGVSMVFDPNYRPGGWESVAEYRHAVDRSVRATDVVLPTLHDEQLIVPGITADQVATQYLRGGAGCVVVKSGTDPTIVATSAGSSAVMVENAVPAVDTTGAGDSFNAGYLAARIRGCSQESAVRVGQRLSALVVQHPGGVPAISAMPEMEDLVEQLRHLLGK